MVKLFTFCLLALVFLSKVTPIFAQNSFVSIVNPIRGEDFWEENFRPEEVVGREIEALNQSDIPATWLIRFDALTNFTLISALKTLPNDEKGLFLEITPSWTKDAGVNYQVSDSWHFAGSVFLTGYEPSDRLKLVDSAFSKFKEVFGYYPKSVGAWWIDSYSLNYMQDKYAISGALIVSDQYTTDNYQIWGQYFSTPYYPAKGNTLLPAQSVDNKIPVVVMQWAARDPLNGYGDGVQESTYSVQANDYLDYHDLGTDYFGRLVDLYTTQPLNQFGHLVVGLENSYSWDKYGDEYQKQIQLLKEKKDIGQLTLPTMKDFSRWYQKKFPTVSPEHILVVADPLQTDKFAVWFMNPYYRLGWFYNKEGVVIRDVRQYLTGQTEPCYQTACQKLNFATFSTRVLDDVTYKKSLLLDRGRITDIKVQAQGENYILSYRNEAGNQKEITLMPRDIKVNGKISTIDGFILDVLQKAGSQPQNGINVQSFTGSPLDLTSVWVSAIKFLLFAIFALLIPGFLMGQIFKQKSALLNIFLSFCFGFVGLTLISYISGYLGIPWLVFIYPAISLFIFFFRKIYRDISWGKDLVSQIKNLAPVLVIIVLGTVFQSLAVGRSGLVYDFGVGFWGPTGHDGIWHQALVNELIKHIPPNNPAFSGVDLSNYHYFYDLLVATTFKLSQIPVMDLLYRFYPVLFSLLLGLGTTLLTRRLSNNKLVILVALYFVYFAGSFGWIVDYLKTRQFAGESAFWVNQPVSMNLNPPFTISLLLVIAIVLVLPILESRRNLAATVPFFLLAGSLVEFKVYAGIIVLGSLMAAGLLKLILAGDWLYLQLFLGSFLVAAGVFLPQNFTSSGLLVLSPFWFIHSMIDFPDRVGWLRLSQARTAYIERGEWLKYLMAEVGGLILFIIGNLGTRFIALLGVTTIIKKNYRQDINHSFILGMTVIGLLMPIFFIQKGNNWNTIQFFYYVLYFMAVFAAIVMASIYQRLPKTIGILVVVIILVLTPINAITSFTSFFGNLPPAILTLGEFEALNFLKEKPDGVVLTYPFDKNKQQIWPTPYPLSIYETTAYVSAFSAKPTFIEDEIQQEILQNDYQKRLVGVNDFFNGKDMTWSRNFLVDNNIRYLYLPKEIDLVLDHDKLKIKQIYANSDIKIYEVLN